MASDELVVPRLTSRAAVLWVAGTGVAVLRSIHLPVLALTDYVKQPQSPATLRALAGEVERWAPQRATVAEQLRRQAEHLEAGGSAEDSPLASLVTHGVTTAAKGGGAAGGSSLLD